VSHSACPRLGLPAACPAPSPESLNVLSALRWLADAQAPGVLLGGAVLPLRAAPGPCCDAPRCRRHAGALQGVHDGRWPDGTDHQWTPEPGHVAGHLAVRAPVGNGGARGRSCLARLTGVCVCEFLGGGAPPAKPLLRGCLRDEPECPGSLPPGPSLPLTLQRPRWAAAGGGDHPGGRLRCGCGTQPGTATLCWGATLPPADPWGVGPPVCRS
jgi:hypothetical protein